MSVNVALICLLALLMVLVAGKRGIVSFGVLILNFCALYGGVWLIASGMDPILLAVLASIGISGVILFLINGINAKTMAAFFSTIVVVAIMILLTCGLGMAAHIQGFSIEEVSSYGGFQYYIGINYAKVTTAVIILGLIGAIVDAAIAISSAMYEVYENNPHLHAKQLFQSGMVIGKDILCTTTNTLYFAALAGFVPLMIWFWVNGYSTAEVINNQILTQEVISVLCSASGAIMIIPISAGLTCYLLCGKPAKRKTPNQKKGQKNILENGLTKEKKDDTLSS